MNAHAAAPGVSVCRHPAFMSIRKDILSDSGAHVFISPGDGEKRGQMVIGGW